jgi:mannose-6-phosphate isomerase-like protein (cupin superfamily)
MSPYRIDPSEITWSDAAPGLKTADIATDLGAIRFAVFSAGFRDTEWCAHEHLGYCLEGEAQVAFENGETITLKPGDVVTIPAGAKHKTAVGPAACRIVFFKK